MIYVSFTNKKIAKTCIINLLTEVNVHLYLKLKIYKRCKLVNKIEDTKNKMELRERIFYKLNVSRKGHAFLLIH